MNIKDYIFLTPEYRIGKYSNKCIYMFGYGLLRGGSWLLENIFKLYKHGLLQIKHKGGGGGIISKYFIGESFPSFGGSGDEFGYFEVFPLLEDLWS